MTYPNIKNMLSLPIKQRLFLLALGFVILMIAISIEGWHQYNQQKLNFIDKVKTIIEQQEKNVQHAQTLLDALTQYQTSSSVKSIQNYQNFAQGLLKLDAQAHLIGIAAYLHNTDKNQFEAEMHIEGFESFNIRSKGLFENEIKNTFEHYLPIRMITPLQPKTSVFLSQDLLSLPGLNEKLMQTINQHKTSSQLLQMTLDKRIYTLLFNPIYHNDPDKLSLSQRQLQASGVAFILIPVEALIIKQIEEAFLNADILLTTAFTQRNNPIIKTLITPKTEHLGIFSLPFNNCLPLLSQDSTSYIDLTTYWHLSDLKAIPLIIIGLFTLLFYFLLTAISLFIYRYTKHLQRVENRLSQIITTSQNAIIVTQQTGYVLGWNPEASKIFGYTEQEAIGECIVKLIFNDGEQLDPTNSDQEKALCEIFTRDFQLTPQRGSTSKVELNLHTKSGKQIVAEITSSTLQIDDPFEISFFIQDVTYQRQTEVEIKQLAYFDPLTNLENRTYFKSQVEQHINAGHFGQFAVMFLDLDGFKQVNDSLGHGVGDELLKVISKRICNTLRAADRDTHICRFGGDEFVFMLGNANALSVPGISMRLLQQIERLAKIGTDDLNVTASIGIAFYPNDGADVDTLLRHADTAMYQSKEAGKNTFTVYNDKMEVQLSKRFLLEKHLRNALNHNEFTLAYQPQINLRTGQVIGVEALIRWNNPILGSVPPDEFISIAEESNLIITIGDWVARTCIQQLIQWQNSPFKELHIAINVSSAQLQHPYFLESVHKMMNNAELSMHLLEIELTERAIMSNAEENIARFQEIREQGFGLSVDDFGTGYSSLSYLKKFPLSILKIDKSFVDGLPDDEEDISITSAILNLAHNLNMRVVAEGVETFEQLSFLTRLDCNYAQGYYISRPIPIQALENWLNDNQQNFYHTLNFKENS